LYVCVTHTHEPNPACLWLYSANSLYAMPLDWISLD